MLLENIKLLQGAILIQPTQDTASSFSTESKKYDRKAVGIIKGIDDTPLPPVNGAEHIGSFFHKGDRVIYNDSHSIDFSIDGVALSIIFPTDIVAIIKEDK